MRQEQILAYPSFLEIFEISERIPPSSGSY